LTRLSRPTADTLLLVASLLTLRLLQYEDARSKFGVPSQDFNLFARIATTKDAWRHTAKNIVLDLMAEMSSTKTAPPWEKISKPMARTLLKDR